MDPRAGLDVVANRKILSPCQELNPSHPACSLVAIPYKLKYTFQNLFLQWWGDSPWPNPLISVGGGYCDYYDNWQRWKHPNSHAVARIQTREPSISHSNSTGILLHNIQFCTQEDHVPLCQSMFFGPIKM
jgi:hypothetical protein